MQLDLTHARSRLLKVALGTFVLMALVNLPSTISYFQLRQEIDRRYDSIEWAKQAVVDHLRNGTMSALAAFNTTSRDQVSISPESGIITLAFNDMTAVNGGTLKFLPIVISDGVERPLEKFLKTELPLDGTMIYWACSSTLVSSRDEYIVANKGTLDAEFAPPACR